MDPERARSEELARSRENLRRKLSLLRTQFARILEYLDHMDSGDIDRVYVILERVKAEGVPHLREELRAVHDDEQCQLDREREGLIEDEPEPTLGQFVRDLFRRRG